MADPLRVLIHNDQTDSFVAALTQRFPDVECTGCTTYDNLPSVISEYRPQVVYSVRFAGTPGFPRDALFGPGGPQWVANGGVGTDHFGLWDPKHVSVTNAAGVASGMMAEYILGGFLHFTLDVPGLQSDKTARIWRARSVQPLSGKTLLIVGLGHTGQALALRAKTFGMTVIGTRANPAQMDNVDEAHPADALINLLPRADFIAVCTPLTAQTRGCIGSREIAAVKPGAILADVSRGGVVDQSALAEGLKHGPVAAAVLDVFETEPLPTDSPFWQMENVLLSPHCSSVFPGWDGASFEGFLSNLGRWINGDPLTNIVDPGRGY